MLAANHFLHEELAAGAPLPLHPLSHLVQHHVLPAPVAPGEPLVLVAGHAGVPRRHTAPRAEQPPAHLALRLGHAPLAAAAVLVRHHHLGAVRERAVGAARAEEHGLAELGAPPLEHVGRERRAAELRVERPGARRVGAPHHGAGASLDLGADVAGEARAAERVRAGGAAAVGLGGRHELHADAAWVLASRHCRSPQAPKSEDRRVFGEPAVTTDDSPSSSLENDEFIIGRDH